MSDMQNVRLGMRRVKALRQHKRCWGHQVLWTTCTTAGLTVEDMRGHNRSIRMAWPRGLAMWLMYNHASMSYAGIGRLMNRDHTTVIDAVRKTPERLALPEDWQDPYLFGPHSKGNSARVEGAKELRRIHDVVVRELGL